jgi:hypothetical protein
MFKTRKVIAEMFSIVGAIRQQCMSNLVAGGHTVKVEPAPASAPLPKLPFSDPVQFPLP